MYYIQNYHNHLLTGVTTLVNNHTHQYNGKSEYSANSAGHTHYYRITTTNNDGHTHLVLGNTAPAVYLSDGSHYHLFSGQTSVAGLRPHTHQYSDNTSL